MSALTDAIGIIFRITGENSGAKTALKESGEDVEKFTKKAASDFEKYSDAVESLQTKLRAMRPGDVVSIGAAENPGAFADAVEAEFTNDSRRTERFFRNTGQA